MDDIIDQSSNLDHGDGQRASDFNLKSMTKQPPHPWQPYADLIGLRYGADFRTLLIIAAYYVLLTLAWRYDEAISAQFMGARIITVGIVSLFSFFCATIVHNVVHCALFQSKHAMLNSLVYYILSVSYGHPVSAFVPGHNESHHKYTELMRDPMRTSKLRYRWNLLNFLLYQPTVAVAVFRNDLEYALLQRALGRPFFRRMMSEHAVNLACTIFLLYNSPLKFFLYYYVPHLVAQWGIVSINHLQHDGCDVNENRSQYGNIARNFTDKALNYLTCNNGFHSIHHMKPQLHWSLLPLAHEELVVPFLHPALDQKSITHYLFKAYVAPGVRLRFDGKPVTFPEGADVDECWIRYPPALPRETMTFEAHCKAGFDYCTLALTKLSSPFMSSFKPVD